MKSIKISFLFITFYKTIFVIYNIQVKIIVIL